MKKLYNILLEIFNNYYSFFLYNIPYSFFLYNPYNYQKIKYASTFFNLLYIFKWIHFYLLSLL